MALNIQRKPGTVGKSSGDARNKSKNSGLSTSASGVTPQDEDSLEHTLTTPNLPTAESDVQKHSTPDPSASRGWTPRWHQDQASASSVAFQPMDARESKGPPVARVANIRKAELRKNGFNDLEDWLKDPNNVYIGRDMSVYVKGAVGSKWQNPYKSKKLGRDESVRLYEEYIRSNPTALAELDELQGKCLGCWCHPLSCHGHVLVRLLEEKLARQDEKPKPL